MPIIAIDGLDGSGKHTQAKLLVDELSKAYHAHLLDFPRYDRASSTLVREYLSGRTSADPVWENPYLASCYYACDRAISHQTEEWRDWLAAGHVVVCDRYVTANMIYQAAKLPDDKKLPFLRWLVDFETNKLRIPAPDLVLYLKLSYETALRLMDERSQQNISPDKNLNGKKDAHESDADYQYRCFDTAIQITEWPEFKWNSIDCDDGERGIKSMENIHGMVMDTVRDSGVLDHARKLHE